jgi:hypothetical protein
MFSDKRIQLVNASDEDQAINPATEETLAALAGFITGAYDSIMCTYDASNNLLTATYKNGVTIVAVLTMTYDLNNNMLTCIKT